ncbi:hypothetical protein ACGFY3_27555 [Streptomyces mirabilis]|uniref:P-loop NTPase n=1 Tax=Streptomyces mirabilis TaxID=68239 RepID=UPI00371B48AF
MATGFNLSHAGASEYPIPAGWELVNQGRLTQIGFTSDLAPFFDGTNPDWRTVLHPGLRPLTVVGKALANTRRRLAVDSSGVELFRGASGVGKSTALLQVAKELVLSDDAFLIWRRDPTAPLKAEEAEQLIVDPRQTVFVADSAETLIEDIERLFATFGIGREQSVQFILASRSADWVRSARKRKSRIDPISQWRRLLEVNDHGGFDRVDKVDAESILESWESCSNALPEKVQNLTRDDAAKAIVRASLGREKGTGALLGALLKIRFGAQGLSSHIASVLDTLEGTELPSGKTLADVLITLSALDMANQDGIPRQILATYADIPESQIRVDIEVPLGKEAVLGSSAGMLHGRHKLISEAVFDLAMGDHDGFSVESSLDHLIASTAKAGETYGYRAGFGRIFDLPQDLAKTTPKSRWTNEVKTLITGRARTVIEFQPERLMSYTALSVILRSVGDFLVAEEEVWNPLGLSLLSTNWEGGDIRGAWVEFATVLSYKKEYAKAAWLSAVALSDLCSSPLNTRTVNSALSVHTLNIKNWHGQDPDVPTHILSETLALFGAIGADDKTITFVTRSCGALGLPLIEFSGVEHFMRVFLTSFEFASSGLSEDWIRGRIGENGVSYSQLNNYLSREGVGH